jgi:hypothetical protein
MITYDFNGELQPNKQYNVVFEIIERKKHEPSDAELSPSLD